jgi:hypothetical protein
MDENNKNQDPGQKDDIPEFQDEELQKLPGNVKRVIQMGFMMQRLPDSESNSFSDKLNEKHIDKILELNSKEEEFAYKDSQNNKIFNLIYIILIAGIFIFLTIYLSGTNSELYRDIIKIGAGFIGGIGGGFAYKTYLDRKNSK